MRIELYNSGLKSQWDSFVKGAKNGHFLFERDFMEYHADRFEDYSLIAYENDKLISVLPANRVGSTLHSHQGLTFGGFLIDDRMKAAVMIELFAGLTKFLSSQDFNTLIYKPIPYIYSKRPAEEDRYALFINNAELVKREISTTIKMANRVRYRRDRKSAMKRAVENGLHVQQSHSFDSFWDVLEQTLADRHQAKPVHSRAEIYRLATLFPNNVKLYVATKSSTVLAGAVIFENSEVAHAQYLATNATGRGIGALDFVIGHLLDEVYSAKAYFDFGTSNEEAGRFLNTGLIDQKESFGGSSVVQDTVRVSF